MAEEEYNYKCLRCGYEYVDTYDKSEGPEEITCPKCRSNSVKRSKKKQP
jgi:DNA-directed RNA polymerase subunit RPC12/RpoP